MTEDWRTHPKLKGRFHASAADDVQVLAHDGGPRLTDRRPELVWVRVTACDGEVFTGTVLNQPHQLTLVQQGTEIRFVAQEGGPLLQVRERYLSERADWIIHPCDNCGLSELFDAPSELIRIVFPNTRQGASIEMCTVRCGACGGAQVAEYRLTDDDNGQGSEARAEQRDENKKWWEFWK